jgi:HEAT repeat protein
MVDDALAAMVEQVVALFHDPSTLDPAADPYGPLRTDPDGALATVAAMAGDDPDPGRRAARADLLGQIADRRPALAAACAAPLAEMAAAEGDVAVLACLADALGHVHHPRATASVAGLLDHRHAAVRRSAVHAAALQADPALCDALRAVAERADDDAERAGVAAALRRCRPEAAEEAFGLEVALLTTVQASMAESGMEPFDVALTGEYPVTEVVLTRGDRQERHRIWDFDEADPADPSTLDLAFAMNRLANIATWL